MLPLDDNQSSDIVKLLSALLNGDPKFRIQGYYNVTSINYPNLQTNISVF